MRGLIPVANLPRIPSNRDQEERVHQILADYSKPLSQAGFSEFLFPEHLVLHTKRQRNWNSPYVSQIFKIHHYLGMGTGTKNYLEQKRTNQDGANSVGVGRSVCPTVVVLWLNDALNLTAVDGPNGSIQRSCIHSTCSASGSLDPFLTGSRHPLFSFGPWGT